MEELKKEKSNKNDNPRNTVEIHLENNPWQCNCNNDSVQEKSDLKIFKRVKIFFNHDICSGPITLCGNFSWTV